MTIYQHLTPTFLVVAVVIRFIYYSQFKHILSNTERKKMSSLITRPVELRGAFSQMYSLKGCL